MHLGNSKGKHMRKDENALYWIWLAEKFGIASKEFPSFVASFDDPYDVYRMSAEEIEQIEGLKTITKERLADKSLELSYKYLKYCQRQGIDVIGYTDERYPARLRTIENPPVMLYCLGKLPNVDQRLCIGMVGTRKMSEYGKRSAYKIAYELSAARVCVVSGMALGIDGVCAAAALKAGGETVAVLGCGLSVVYPKEHAKLMRKIAKHGAVISEFPPFERPLPNNFPIRNRIISGMSNGVLVVEAPKRSGALITASRAISQGRELFALPGQIGEATATGPNELIQSGANVVLSANDLINHYDFLYHDTFNFKRLAWATKHSDFDERTLKEYGVSDVFYRGRYDAESEKAENEKSEEPTEAQNAQVNTQAVNNTLDKSILQTLDVKTREIYSLIPDGVAFVPDDIASRGADIRDVITSLTLLEISGLIISQPGGAYKKQA
ncbi:MAG: DNA-protecting protein DprA [Ruminococcaceae bacterium]|nr:DNA-protecting protein DprA [Oscillospiraceae bacterium]